MRVRAEINNLTMPTEVEEATRTVITTSNGDAYILEENSDGSLRVVAQRDLVVIPTASGINLEQRY